jgi:hypothetical protein
MTRIVLEEAGTMKLPYKEGTWFAVPLRDSGFAIGLVARATRRGGVILCYFFGPNRTSVPSLADVEPLRRDDALCAWSIGNLHFIEGKWPIIGESTSWSREEWPMPQFIRREDFSGRAWRVYYSDQDPNKVIREEAESYDCETLETDSLRGAGAVEIALSKILLS